jgi:hypothetical protein
MTQLVTVIVSLLAGAVVVTMTAPPIVAIVTVCGTVATTVIVAKAMGKI